MTGFLELVIIAGAFLAGLVVVLAKNPSWRPFVLGFAALLLGFGLLVSFWLVNSRVDAFTAATLADVAHRRALAKAHEQQILSMPLPASPGSFDPPASEVAAAAESKPFDTNIQYGRSRDVPSKFLESKPFETTTQVSEAIDPTVLKLDFAWVGVLLLAFGVAAIVVLLCFPTGRRIVLIGAAMAFIALFGFRFALHRPVATKTVSESRPLPVAPTSNTQPSDQPKPDWVDGPAKQDNNQYYVAVSSELFKDAPDCETSLNEAIAAAAQRFLETLGEGSARAFKIDVAEVRAQLAQNNYWWETVESPTVGKMLRLHANVKFDITTLRQRLREFQVSERVEYAAMASGATLGLLGLAFVILKRPPATAVASPAPDLVAGKPPG